jgi:hypothetical protein
MKTSTFSVLRSLSPVRACDRARLLGGGALALFFAQSSLCQARHSTHDQTQPTVVVLLLIRR